MVFTIALDEFHTAHLDPVTGCGLIVCPRPDLDVWLDGESIFCAAWNDATARLTRMGWSPMRDLTGFLRYEGCTADGSLVVAAYADDALVRQTTGTLDHATWRSLCVASGLEREPAPRAF